MLSSPSYWQTRSVRTRRVFPFLVLVTAFLPTSWADADNRACADDGACSSQVLLLANDGSGNGNGNTLLRYNPMASEPIKMSLVACKLGAANRKFLSSGADLLIFGRSLVSSAGRLCRIAQGQTLDKTGPNSSINGAFDIKNSAPNWSLAWMGAADLAFLESPGENIAQVRFYDALPRLSSDYALVDHKPLGWPINPLPINPVASDPPLLADLLVNAGTGQLMVSKLSQDQVLRLTAVAEKNQVERSKVKFMYDVHKTKVMIKALIPLAPDPLSIVPAAVLARQMGAIALFGEGGIAFVPAVRENTATDDDMLILEPARYYTAAAVAWAKPPLDQTKHPGTESSGILVTSYADEKRKQFTLAAAPLRGAQLTRNDGIMLTTNQKVFGDTPSTTPFDNIAIIPLEPPSRYFPLTPPVRYAVLAFSGPQARWYEVRLSADGKVSWEKTSRPLKVPDKAVLSGEVVTVLPPLLSFGPERRLNLAVGQAEGDVPYSDLPLKALGSADDISSSQRTLLIAAGDCQATAVKLIVGNPLKPELQRDLLSPPYTSVRDAAIAPGKDMWLRFMQAGPGEECTMRIRSTDIVSMYTTEALVHIQSGKLSAHALALVLDTSASMKRFIAGSPDVIAYSHAQALRDAMQSFAGLLSLIPDASEMDVFLTPFNSDAGMPRKTTGGSLKSMLNDPQYLLPAGETNILAGLERATAALADTNQTVKAHRSVFLITDGQHNYHLRQRAQADQLEPLQHTSPPAGPSESGSQMLQQAKIEHFFSAGISPYAEHPALNRLVRNVAGNPTGGSQFVTEPSMLETTFLHVLWKLLLTSFLARDEGSLPAVDPIDLDKNTKSIPLDISQADREIFVTVVGHRADSRIRMMLELNGKPLLTAGSPWCVPQVADPQQGAKFTACRLTQAAIAGLHDRLVVKLTNMGPQETHYRLEVTARSNIELSGTFAPGAGPDGTLTTGGPVTLDVAVRSHNRPLAGMRLTARVRHPQNSVGGLLADESLAQASMQVQDHPLNEDSSNVLGKLQRLMEVADIQKVQEEELSLTPVADASKPGTYRLVFTPPISGPYEVEVIVAPNVENGILTPHGQVFTAYVEPGLDCTRSIKTLERTIGAGATGTLATMIQPTDGKGSFLGPSRGAELGFEQPGNTDLAWNPPTDAESLTGLYSVLLTHVQEGPVFLVTAGGRCLLELPPPESQILSTGGCSCELGTQQPKRSPAGYWAVLLLLCPLLWRAYTRRHAAGRRRLPRA